MNPKKVLQLIGAIVLCELAGLVGTIFTAPNIPTWYASLTKPFFSPPNWVFGPVWTLLFFLMGIALFIVFAHKEKKKAKEREKGLKLFGLQLGLNILWSGLFFGLKSPLLGLIGIIVLWIAIAKTMLEFRKVSNNAYLLMVPYIAWVSFATILNLAILILNP